MQTLIVNISNQNELSYIEALELFSKPIETKEKLQKKTIVNLVRQANKDKNARKKV